MLHAATGKWERVHEAGFNKVANAPAHPHAPRTRTRTRTHTQCARCVRHAIAAAVTTSRSAGWVEQTRSALLAATRARSLTALKTIADVLRYERTRDPWSVEDEAAMFAPPLLQLAVTTRSEVTTLSRILLEQHVGGVRLRRAKAWLRSVPGKPAATLAAATAGLHGSGATDNGTSTEKTTEFEGPEPTTMVAVQLVREVMGLWTKEFVKVLLELGCDPSARDEQGENAVHVAALYGNTAALATMLDASAAGSRGGDDDAGGGAVAELVDATSKSGHVAVELAAMRGRVLTTCHLLHRLNAATTERVPSYLAVYGVHSDDCLAMLEGRPPPRRTTPWVGAKATQRLSTCQECARGHWWTALPPVACCPLFLLTWAYLVTSYRT